MAEKVVSKVATKIVKKRWVSILAPKVFNERVIGESYVVDPEVLKGRCVSANMMVLTGDSRKQQINIKFQITEVKEGKGLTVFRGLAFSPNSIRRMIRRGRDKVDDSFLCKTQDNVVLRVKPFIITNSMAAHSVQTSLRRGFRKKMKEIVAKQAFEQVIRDVLDYKLQNALREVLYKIAPLRTLDIRVLKIEDVPYTETETFEPEPVKEEEELEEEVMEEPIAEKEEIEVTEKEAEEQVEEVQEDSDKKAPKKKAKK